MIASTTTSTGLKVYARLDEGSYPNKIKVTDAELAAVRLAGEPFHPEVELNDHATPTNYIDVIHYRTLTTVQQGILRACGLTPPPRTTALHPA